MTIKKEIEMNRRGIIQKMFLWFGVAVLLSACEGAMRGDGTYVWIDVPTNGLTVPIDQPVQVEGHTTSPGGVEQVEIWINGVQVDTIRDLPSDGELARFNYAWTPTEEGEYVIQVVSIGKGGSGNAQDATRVIVGETTSSQPVEVIETDTPTPPPGTDVQFWAEPEEIQAGACTTIYWHAENVQSVVFGGLQQKMDGSYEDCLCKDERYTLTVTHLDNTEEKLVVNISVSGSCEATEEQEPDQDTKPPPVPSPDEPANGSSLSCRSNQTLTWLPVSDDSGIEGYYVKIEKENNSGKWQSAGGFGPIGGNQVSVNVECGFSYRWIVRAEDRAGNVSNWSAPSEFQIDPMY